MERVLPQTSTYEIESRFSNFILDTNGTRNRVYAADWKGNLHILRFYKQDAKLEMLKAPQRITDGPILSLEENRKRQIKDINKLFIGDGDGKLMSYDIVADKSELIGSDEGSPICKIISVENKNLLFTFSWDRKFHMWDTTKKEMIYRHSFKENFITAEYVHPYIVALFGNNTIAFINVETYSKGSVIRQIPIGHSEPVKSIALTSNLQYMALGDIQGRIKILKKKPEITDFNFLDTRESLIGSDYNIMFDYQAHFAKLAKDHPDDSKCNFPVTALAFNPKNPNVIISAGGDGSLYEVDIELEEGYRHNAYAHEEDKAKFMKPFSHLKFNNEGTALLTAEIEDNSLDIFKGLDSPYTAKATLRSLRLK